MTRKFSLAHLSLLDCSPPELTYIAAKAGYDFVGFRTITYKGLSYSLSDDKAMLRQTKAALAETGLKLL